jgi:hypothetical protein
MCVTYCCWPAAGLRQLLRVFQAILHDLDRFAKRQAGESGWSACVVDWRDLYMRVPQCLASGSSIFPQEKVQEYLLYTVIIGKIQNSLGHSPSYCKHYYS